MDKKVTVIDEQMRLVQLQELIRKHDELYEKNQPIITDSEYDELYFELVELESKYPFFRENNSPTQKVYTTFVKELKKVKHRTPILSLDKANTEEMVIKFLNRFKGEFLLQEKLDGLTIVLHYEDGRLVQASTRGSGEIGEDVTHAINAIKGVPKRIKDKRKIVLRAECIMTYKAFEKANIDGKYNSPRNLASGTIRQLNTEIIANRDLEVIITEVVEFESDYTKDMEQLVYIKSLGFNVVTTYLFNTDTKEGLQLLLDKIKSYEHSIRATLPYMIDGLVIKTNDLATRLKEGYTSHHPRWAVSFKFKSQDAITTLKQIIVQVGKMGYLTPVAIFEPIKIDGSTIERATLHNFVLLESKDIRVGDKILVAKANDVIPKVVKAFHEHRTTDLPKFETPTTCPVCNSKVELEEDNSNLICTNYNCDGTRLGKLQHFVSRNAMNIQGLGDKTVEVLYEKGIVTSIKDLYSLQDKEADIVNLDGFGKTSYEKMLKGLEESKTVPFERVLYALAIQHVGESASKDIVKHLQSLDNLISLYKEGLLTDALLKIDGIGIKISTSLVKAFHENMELFELIKSIGLMTSKEIVETETSFDLSGVTICLTGSFNQKDRKVWKKEFEDYGAKVSGSVSKKTDYLVMGDGTEGKSKHLTAVDLGVKILKEDEIESMLSSYKK